MRSFWLLILIFTLICTNIFDLQATSDNSYSIKINGEQRNNNYYTTAKYYFIKNDSSLFLPNTFYLKTKNSVELTEKTIFNVLQSNAIEIKSIRKPYEIIRNNEQLLNSYYGLNFIYQVVFSGNMTTFEVSKILNESGNFEYAIPIYKQKLLEFTPDDPLYGIQWSLKKILASEGWDISKGDSSVIIGLVDSGTDIDHNDLKNKVKYNYLENPNDKIDNDGNGFIDDYYGWDFVGNITLDEATQNYFVPDNNPKPLLNSNEHGTHTAGIISAQTNNSVGISGIAINCRFVPVKVAMDNMSAPKGSGDIFFGFEGILYCLKRGCSIINLSWEVMGNSPVDEEVINFATKSGATIIAASGNDALWADRYKTFPAQYDNVISVGASDSFDRKSSFSHYGYNIDIYAPGSAIHSTIPANSYEDKSGTSMAAPVVTGIAALIKSIHKDWTNNEIMQQIRSTSDNTITSNETLRPFLYGRVNLKNALMFNNKAFPSNKKPGLNIKEIQFLGSDAINSYDTVTVRLVVKNYLSACSDVKIKLETGDLFLNIYDNNLSIPQINEQEEMIIESKMKLSSLNLWFKGNALLTVEFTANEYKNYQLLNIPIDLQSYNKFIVAYNLPDLGLYFFDGDSKNEFHLSAIANSEETIPKGYLLNYRTKSELVKFPDEALCVYSLNENVNFIGSNSKLFIEKSGLFSQINISSLANKVYGFHFYDENHGFLGGIKSNKMIIAKTDDGGLNWTNVNLPIFSPNEVHSSNDKLFYAKDSLIYFVSNSGKIVFSNDYGKNWDTSSVSGIKPEFLAVSSINNLMILYYSSNDNYYKVSTSNNAGKSWTNINSNLSLFNPTPVYLTAPDSSNSFIISGIQNEVYSSSDSGKTWKSILSKEYDYNRNTGGACFLKKDGRLRLWNFSSDLTYLDFDNEPKFIRKKLTNISSKTIDFGDLKIDSSNTIFVFFKNTGNTRTSISKIFLNPKDELSSDKFIVVKPLPAAVSAGAIENMQIKFSSKVQGKFEATIQIFSDADTSLQEIKLIATAWDPKSVILENQHDLSVRYNADDCEINISNSENQIKSIKIINLSGQIIYQNAGFTNDNLIQIKTDKFYNGIYFIEITDAKSQSILPLLIAE